MKWSARNRRCFIHAHGKASPQHTAPVQPIPVTEWRFTNVHVDLVGPLPASAEGFKYLFSMVDRSSRWLEAVPLKSMAAEDCVDVLISTWVARFGVPTIITSDKGRQFNLPVGGPHQAAGYQARADHPLPPAVQRDGGEDARAAEGCLKGVASRLEMARTLAMGATGPANRPKRRRQRLGS